MDNNDDAHTTLESRKEIEIDTLEILHESNEKKVSLINVINKNYFNLIIIENVTF